VAVAAEPSAVAVNPVTNKVYVANILGNSVTVIDGTTNGTTTVALPVGSYPRGVAVNPVTNKVYVANTGDGISSSNTVTVIDGTTDTVATTVTVGFKPTAIAVNSVTNQVYVANFGGTTVTVIDGATNATTTVTVGTAPYAVAVNPLTNKVYVTNWGSNNVTVFDGATKVPTTVPVGSGPRGVAVNLVTNKVYIANYGNATVSVLDGITNGTAPVAVGTHPEAVTVNPVTNQVYVVNQGGGMTVIDGATNGTTTVTAGSNPFAVAVNPVTNQVYLANSNSNNVTIIDVDQSQAVPITVVASGVQDAQTVTNITNLFATTSSNPTFTATATSAFATLTSLYYWVDDRASIGWTRVAPATGTFSITPSGLSLGVHSLYVFAAYGAEGVSASSGNGSGNSPEISNLVAVPFVVLPIGTTTAVSADANPQDVGGTVTFTATVTPDRLGSSSPTGIVSLFEGSTLLSSGALVDHSGSYRATFTTSGLTAGSHTLKAIYSGDAVYGASSGTATEKILIASTVYTWPTADAITYGQGLAASWLSGGTSTPSGDFAWTTPNTAPNAGTASYSMTFTPRDPNYGKATSTVSLTVLPAWPTLTWPTASAITYGQTLASSTLSGGTSTAAGTFAWRDPATTPATGTSGQYVTFTPTDTTNYYFSITTGSILVNKATATLTWPTASTITYGQTLASSTLRGGSSSQPGTFTWTTPATVPSTGTASYGVTFTPTDTTNYNTATSTVSVTVNKATATITWPTASSVTYGQTLAASTLSGGTSTPAGTFAWTTLTTAPRAGTASYNVTFTPTDTTNYNTEIGTVSVTVPAPLGFSGLGRALTTVSGATLAGVFVGPDGTIYLGEVGNAGAIHTLTPQGTPSVLTVTGAVDMTGTQALAFAMDGARNLYIADYGNARIIKVTPGGVGSLVDMGSVVLTIPSAVVMDSKGNLFVVDEALGLIKVPAAGPAYVVTLTGSLPVRPFSLAIDASDQLYLSDVDGNQIITYAANSTFGQVLAINGLAPPLNGPLGIAVDRLGNLFIADQANQRIVVVDASGNSFNLDSVVASPEGIPMQRLSAPIGVAVDAFGTIYIADGGPDGDTGQCVSVALPINPALTFGQTGYSLNHSVIHFGHVSLGTVTPITQTLTVTLGATAAGSFKVLTKGTAGLDFQVVVGAGTTLLPWASSTSATIQVQFLPTAPGLRTGAVVIYDGSGNTLLTIPLVGFADAPVAALSPSTAAILTISGTPVHSPGQVALDGAGNLYVANGSGGNVLKIPVGGGASSVVNTGGTTLQHPLGVAMDGAGNLFIADGGHANTVVVVTPAGSSSVLTINPTPSPYLASALTFDGAGNLYIADETGRVIEVSGLVVSGSASSGNGTVLGTGAYTPGSLYGVGSDPQGTVYIPDRDKARVIKVSPNGVASLLAPPEGSSWSFPHGVSADGFGNVYVSDYATGVAVITSAGVASWVPTQGLYVAPSSGGVAIDPKGNIFIGDSYTNGIVSVNVGGASLAFASTAVLSKSSDSPQTATVTNLGNQNLIFSADPTYTLSFSQSLSASNPVTSATILVPGTTANVPVDFIPQSAVSLNANLTLTDNSLNVAGATQRVAVSGTGMMATATITWPSASAITYGQTLASSTLSGGSSTPVGAFAWTTPATVPSTGTASYSVTFTPTDTTNYNTATSTVSLPVNKATATITWPTASAITYGQTLASSTLSGGSSTPAGAFAWTTPATVPSTGTASYSVTFTPTDTTNHNTATSTVSLTVNKATATITWPTASSITYGQTLAASSLSGGTSTPVGTFAWTTPATVPTTGTASYSVTFTPTDTTNYHTATSTVSLTVNKATATTTWPTASAITYGQTLIASTLSGGTSTPAGTFAWTTPATVPSTGTASYSVTFTPTDTTNYNTATSTVSLTVNKATATITWPTASSITYGQTLATSTLSGGSSTPAGTFSWTTPATVPSTGTASYSVTFTPTDTTNYNTATSTVSLTVNKAAATIDWPTASAITYGQTLATSTLSGGSSTPAGTFAWTTPATVPSTGTASYSVTFTPTDTTNYNTATSTVSLTVSKATATITWPTASAITYGQTLVASTLSGGASTPTGTFAWTTPATVPSTGTASYSVIFTPTDTTNYATATSTVSLTVNKATATITWPSASLLSYGQTLAASALSGGSSTPAGAFAWTAPTTVPSTGIASYSVTFTPTDTTNYAKATSTVSLTVNQATATITWPTASAITYGQPLASSTLSGGSSTPAGTFAWTTPATVPSTGTASYSVTFTPTDTTNYATATSTLSVTVNKATATITWPTASVLTYGQTLAAATLSGGTSTPAGAFAWTTPSTTPSTGTASYSVTFTPTDTTNYNTATRTVSVTVTEVLPIVYTVTFATDGTTGATLTGSASQAVNSGTSATAVTANAPAGYTFVNWAGTNGFVTSTSNPLTVNPVTAAYAITAHFSADAVVITVPPAPTVTVNPGNGVATTTLTLAGQGVVSNPVTLTATGLPTGATCTFSSSTVNLANGPAKVNVTITTTPTLQIIGLNRGITPLGGLGASALFSCGIFVLPSRRSRKRLGRFLSAMVMVLMGGLMGCSGSSNSGGITTGSAGTPAGTYTITLTASAQGAAAATTTFQLIVN
jgi:YVTN family beta-propeller protein